MKIPWGAQLAPEQQVIDFTLEKVVSRAGLRGVWEYNGLR